MSLDVETSVDSSVANGVDDAAELIESAGLTDVADETPSKDVIRIVKGNTSDAEIAVLAAVFAAAFPAPIVPNPSVSFLGGWGSPPDQHRYGLGSAPAVFVNARYSR